MDASEHEYPSMSRHERRVPTSFYSRFSRDLHTFASSSTSYPSSAQPQPRIVACLEGGYSDRALSSGTASFLAGLTSSTVEWEMKDILAMEKTSLPSTKKLSDHLMRTGMVWDLLTGESRQREQKEPVQGMKLRDRNQIKQPAIYEEGSPKIRQKKVIKVEEVAAPVALPAVFALGPEVVPILKRADSPKRDGSPKRNVVWTQHTYEGTDLIKTHDGPAVEKVAPPPAIRLTWKSQGIE